MDYTALTLSEAASGLDAVADDARNSFTRLSATQLNWRPDATRWSVAQCFEHLITSNRLMWRSAEDALASGRPTIWQRLPGLPAMFGRLLIRSQAPGGTRKFNAPSVARPAASAIGSDVVDQFVEQQRDLARRVRALDQEAAVRTIMTSPFSRVITYSVLDGCRLIVAHDRRHVEQAGRVMTMPGFPAA